MPSSLSDYKISGPEWARGCDQCQYGLVGAPEPIRVLTLAEQRAVQADEGLLTFCTCRAGFMQRQYLRKVFNKLEMGTRKNIHEHLSRVPTIHYEPEAA